jgi:hypothetical protein
MKSQWAAMMFVVLLYGCGGGGGGGASGAAGSTVNAPVSGADSALSFAPAQIVASYDYGSALDISVTATVKRPNDFKGASTVYVLVNDTTGILDANFDFSATSPTTYAATLRTSRTAAPGAYSGNFKVDICHDSACTNPFPGSPSYLPFNIHIKPAVSASPAALTLGGENGRNMSPGSLTVKILPVTASWTWKLSGLPSWLKANAEEGSGNQNGATLSFTPDPQGVPVGASTATVTLTATVNGEAAALPINMTLNVDSHKLLATDNGVAFSSTPGWSRLTRTITLQDNLSKSVPWRATSSQPWLLVSSAGTTNASGKSSLTLTANAALLPTDAVSYATVTIVSDDASVSNTEKISVALWKGSASPSSTTSVSFPENMYLQEFSIVADPIRPYVYVNHVGTIDVYNIYTGQLMKTMTGLLGENLTNMTISTNGEKLYVSDIGFGFQAPRKLIVIDLSTYQRSTSFPILSGSDMTYLRPNGVDVITTTFGSYLATNGKTVSDKVGANDVTAATSDGKTLYGGLRRFATDYADIAGGRFIINEIASAPLTVQGLLFDIAASRDGSAVYLASTWPKNCRRLDPATLAPISELFDGALAAPDQSDDVTNVEVGIDGKVYCATAGLYDTQDLWIHGADGSLQTSMKLTNNDETLSKMAISSDGYILAILMSNGYYTPASLVFLPVGP